jgi:hypothetical protein
MEAIRPYTEAWLLSCLIQSRFSKRDFHGENDGTIRITRPLTSYLAMTAPLWHRAAKMVAGWLAECFAGFARRLGGKGIDDDVIAAASIGALMNVHKTSDPTAEGAQPSPSGMVILPKPLPDPLPNFPSPGRAYRSVVAEDAIPRACYECGQALAPRQRKFCSAFCSDNYRAEIRRVLPTGAASPLSPAIREIVVREEARFAKRRRVSDPRGAWEDAHRSVRTDGRRQAEMAAREQLRSWYADQVKPRLMELQPKDVFRVIEVSRAYARQIVTGQIPHRRHFPAPAKLTGVPKPPGLEGIGWRTAASEPPSAPDHGTDRECAE